MRVYIWNFLKCFSEEVVVVLLIVLFLIVVLFFGFYGMWLFRRLFFCVFLLVVDFNDMKLFGIREVFRGKLVVCCFMGESL